MSSGVGILYVNVAVHTRNTNGERIKAERSVMDINAVIRYVTVKRASVKKMDWMVQVIVTFHLYVSGNLILWQRIYCIGYGKIKRLL